MFTFYGLHSYVVKLRMWQKCVEFVLRCTQIVVNSFLPCFYYPCCGDMDIDDQLEMYGH